MIIKYIFSTIIIVILSLISHRVEASEIQLNKGPDDTLEAVLGTGNKVMLKMSMNLEILKTPLDKEKVEVPIRFFLTDFTFLPTTHPAVELNVKVDCESTTPKCILPDKPQSFDSYDQFMDWLKQGYFTNQVSITYDFHLDVQQLAPSLTQHLFAVSPNGYRFIGTNVIDNIAIKPDKCVPQVTYSSKRGNVNTTTATLGGTLYLNSCSYTIDDHQQVFPHSMIDQQVFKKDETKKFYHHQWLAQSEITSNVTYEEFPPQLSKNWLQAPSGTYSLLQKKPGDLEEIDHLACFNGISGEDVDIRDGRILLIDCEAINKKDSKFLESIVKDGDQNLYTVRYLYTELGKSKYEARLILEENKRPYSSEVVKAIADFEIKTSQLSEISKPNPQLQPFAFSKPQKSTRGFQQPQTFANVQPWNSEIQKNAELERKESLSIVKNMMIHYQVINGKPHPRWEEFTRK